MDIEAIKKWFREADPLLVDALMALALAVGVCLQIWLTRSAAFAGIVAIRPDAGVFLRRLEPPPIPIGQYIVAVGAFVPLVWRRRIPWLAVLLTAAFAGYYASFRWSPAFTMLGPLIAVYSLGAHSKRRHTAAIGLLIAGMVVSAMAFTFSANNRGVVELVGSFALLTAAAFLGDTTRSRRGYVEEVEQRAIDAVRTREEEARRRVEEERIRIAREVHDIVAHSLSVVTVQASAAETLLDKDPEAARESVGNVRQTAKSALAELRSMLDVLRTGDGEAPRSPAANLNELDRLLDPIRETGASIELDRTGDLGTLPAYAAVSGYRIVQEALTNVLRHAGASRVVVKLAAAPALLTIEVADNGDGDPTQESPGGGHGLRGMRERVEALGGEFEAGPQASGGYAVRATIPLTRSKS